MPKTLVFLAKTFFIATFCLLSTISINAQGTGQQEGSGFSGGVWFEYSPQYPGPNELVTVRFVTYSGNLDTAEIAWTVNGSLFDAGIGLSAITVRTGAVGEPIPISVAVRFIEGQTTSHTVTLVPAHVAIMWEVDSYTPPFYKGKALRGFNQDVTLIAMPSFINSNGVTIAPSNLLYEWYIGPTKVPQSGVGKQRITLSGEALRIYGSARVVVSTPDRSTNSSATLQIPSTFPRLVLYETHPLYGKMYEQALMGQLFSGTGEFSVFAEPYFFTRNSVKNGLVDIQWSIDNGTSTARGFIQTFAPVAGASGATTIRVKAQERNSIFMQANTTIGIRYGNEQRSFF